MAIKIDYKKCCWKDGKCTSKKSKDSKGGCGCGCGDSCGGCIEACPTGAITRDSVVRIDESKCTECGVCVDACSHGALSLD